MTTRRLKYERHGKFGTHIYYIWSGMIKRCYNKKSINYARYGGAGVTVCDAWRNSFNAFYADMGDPPEGHQLERIKNHLGYYKENCKWATVREQASNRKSNILLTIGGVTKTLKEWTTERGVPYSMAHWRKTVAKLPDEECLAPSTKKRLRLHYQGREYTVGEVAAMLGIAKACVYLRIKKGWSAEEIINRPNSQPYKKPGWKFTLSASS